MFNIFKSRKNQSKEADLTHDVISEIMDLINGLDDFSAKELHGKELKMIYEEEIGLLIGGDGEGNRYVLVSTDEDGKIL